MTEQKKQRSVTLLVDGSVLKRKMIEKGQQQTPQQVVQYLSRMVQAVRQESPGSLIYIQYYGARLNEPTKLPISGKVYVEPELKKGLTHHSVPGAWLNNTWGRVTYSPERPWILRASSLNKNEVTDKDFVLNERSKGVTTQLVEQMANYAVRHPERPLYVYGDIEDMAYAIHTSQWLGAQVKNIEFVDKKPYISDIPLDKESRFVDKEKILQIGQEMKAQHNAEAYLKNLRSQCPIEDKKSVLMIDAGVVRKYLEQKGYEMTPNNTQKILDQIIETLPERPSKTVIYCAFFTPKKLVSPFPGETLAMPDASTDKRILSLPDVEFSAGKTVQDSLYPYILKKEKWHTPASERNYKDFEYYFHQSDVDDRIAYDIALFSMDPTVSQLYLVATDGDFAKPVENASKYGLPTWLIRVDPRARDLSFRLESGVQATLQMKTNATGLITRFAEAETKREAQRAKSDAKRKKIGKMKRAWARAEDDEYEGIEIMHQKRSHHHK